VANKWAVLVLGLLSERRHRFGELQRGIDGVSQKVLTQTLRSLERDGIVERTVHPTVPPKVEYSLTPIGESLAATLGGLRAWAERNIEAVMSNRESFDQAAGANPVGARQDPLRPRESGATD
jgi:DNA-binding HxlR family transcriptional regulator